MEYWGKPTPLFVHLTSVTGTSISPIFGIFQNYILFFLVCRQVWLKEIQYISQTYTNVTVTLSDCCVKHPGAYTSMYSPMWAVHVALSLSRNMGQGQELQSQMRISNVTSRLPLLVSYFITANACSLSLGHRLDVYRIMNGNQAKCKDRVVGRQRAGGNADLCIHVMYTCKG